MLVISGDSHLIFYVTFLSLYFILLYIFNRQLILFVMLSD